MASIHTQMESKVKHQFMDVRDEVESGIPFDQAWNKVFPEDSLEKFYIINGQKRQKLPENLDLLCSHLHDSEKVRISFLSRILEPLMVLILALLVGALVYSVFSFLYGMVNTICEQIT